MDTQIQELQNKLRELENQFDNLSLQLQSHTHDGVSSQQVQIDDIAGRLLTITTAPGKTAKLTSIPKSISEQIFIDVSTATKKLYIWSVANSSTLPATSAWYSVTIT